MAAPNPSKYAIISLAVSSERKEYIRKLATVRGQSMNALINELFDIGANVLHAEGQLFPSDTPDED